jgi:HAD superfamily hydrolase (TIGR01509 family)
VRDLADPVARRLAGTEGAADPFFSPDGTWITFFDGNMLKRIAPEALDDVAAQALAPTFLKPIFATARLDPEAISVLRSLRSHGVKCAIVSNTPWGSPATAWREELTRHGLLNEVDATVFCVDVGWRKPHRAPFDHALALLGVVPVEALFVGDDHRWDVIGARNAGVRPVLLGRDSMNSLSDVLAIRNLGDVLAIATDAYS